MKARMQLDCVKMKRDIQVRLLRQEQRLTWQERNAAVASRAQTDLILSQWFRAIGEHAQPVAMVCDQQTSYASRKKKRQ